VESDIDRDLAEQIALGMDGVRSVDNRLAVGRAEEASEPATPTQRNFAQWVRDATTTAKVKSKLVANAHTKAINIDVDTRNGIVTLKGMVQSAEESMLAEAIARNTDGVEEVYTDLLVIADAG